MTGRDWFALACVVVGPALMAWLLLGPVLRRRTAKLGAALAEAEGRLKQVREFAREARADAERWWEACMDERLRAGHAQPAEPEPSPLGRHYAGERNPGEAPKVTRRGLVRWPR